MTANKSVFEVSPQGFVYITLNKKGTPVINYIAENSKNLATAKQSFYSSKEAIENVFQMLCLFKGTKVLVIEKKHRVIRAYWLNKYGSERDLKEVPKIPNMRRYRHKRIAV